MVLPPAREYCAFESIREGYIEVRNSKSDSWHFHVQYLILLTVYPQVILFYAAIWVDSAAIDLPVLE